MKKKKDEAAAGFRETLQSTLRAYKIWNRYAPNLLTATALHSVFPRSRRTCRSTFRRRS